MIVAALVVLVAGACTPIELPNTAPVQDAPSGPGATEATTAPTEEAVEEGSGAVATIATRSLRVRSAPNPDAEVIAGVREGETYPVLDLSGDGQWVLLAVPAAPDGQGWVAANLVSINGAVSGSADIILVPTPMPSADGTPAPAEEAAVVPAEIPAPDPGFAAVVTDGTRLRVRAEPTTESDIVGYIYAGEVYEVVGANEDGTWFQIAGSTEDVSDNPDGGWVAAEFLLLGQ